MRKKCKRDSLPSGFIQIGLYKFMSLLSSVPLSVLRASSRESINSHRSVFRFDVPVCDSWIWFLFSFRWWTWWISCSAMVLNCKPRPSLQDRDKNRQPPPQSPVFSFEYSALHAEEKSEIFVTSSSTQVSLQTTLSPCDLLILPKERYFVLEKTNHGHFFCQDRS